MKRTSTAFALAGVMALIVATTGFGYRAASSPADFLTLIDTTFNHTAATQEQGGRDAEMSERDEFRRSFQLAPNAEVRVAGINGPVTIETTNGTQADVHVVRSASNRADLEFHKIIVEQTATGLVVRGERDEERRANPMSREARVRHRVTLRLPRQVSLTASGINGAVGVGELDGSARLSGINGPVEVAQVRGYSEVSGINGRLTMTIRQLGEQGFKASGINGMVELRFTDDVNADLSVSGFNGRVMPELPNVTVQGEVRRSNFRARIGAGGAPIKVSGVNGNIRLSRVG